MGGGVDLNKDKRDNKKNILNRLKKIEGQVKGIHRMVEEGKYCGDVMIQISAVRSAINSVGSLMIDNYINECLFTSLKASDDDEKNIKEIINVIEKYVK